MTRTEKSRFTAVSEAIQMVNSAKDAIDAFVTAGEEGSANVTWGDIEIAFDFCSDWTVRVEAEFYGIDVEAECNDPGVENIEVFDLDGEPIEVQDGVLTQIFCEALFHVFCEAKCEEAIRQSDDYVTERHVRQHHAARAATYRW